MVRVSSQQLWPGVYASWHSLALGTAGHTVQNLRPYSLMSSLRQVHKCTLDFEELCTGKGSKPFRDCTEKQACSTCSEE